MSNKHWYYIEIEFQQQNMGHTFSSDTKVHNFKPFPFPRLKHTHIISNEFQEKGNSHFQLRLIAKKKKTRKNRRKLMNIDLKNTKYYQRNN